MKSCRKCGAEKALTEFGVYRSQPDGLHKYCKPCAAKLAADYRANNYEKWLSAQRARQAIAKELHRQATAEAKAAKSESLRLARAERNRVKGRAAYAANPAAYLAKKKALREANPQRAAEYKRRYREKKVGDVPFILNKRMSSMVRKHLMGRKSGKGWLSFFDYSVEELMAHLERQFLAGMSWDNISQWHVDHIIPASSFDISGADDPELRRAWSLPNLRPLWAKDNISKGAKITSLL